MFEVPVQDLSLNPDPVLSGDQVPDPAPGHGTVPVGVGVKQQQILKTDQ